MINSQEITKNDQGGRGKETGRKRDRDGLERLCLASNSRQGKAGKVKAAGKNQWADQDRGYKEEDERRNNMHQP